MTTSVEEPVEAVETHRTNPFPGPKAYSGDDWLYFFGRTDEIEELTSLVLSSSATLLYAPSGTGKSSLLQAGLAPRLEQRFDFVILPTVHLGRDARESTGDGQTNQFVSAVCDTVRVIDEDDVTASDIAAAAATRRPDDSRRVLLILDQFEKVFSDPTLWAERDEFFVSLTAALDRNPWLRAIIALRSDYLAELVPHEPKLPGNLMVRYQLEHLDEAKARTAISEAFEATGVELADKDLETLLDLLLEDEQRRRFGQRIRARHINTIQLQIVCRPLWKELRHREGPVVPVLTRDSTLGLRASMSQFVDEAIVTAVSRGRTDEAAIRLWLSQRLISMNGMRAFVQVEEQQTDELPIRAVEALAEAKLIQLEQRHGTRLAELTHDSMVEGVRASNDAWLRSRYHQQRRRISVLLLVVLLGLIGIFPFLRASNQEQDTDTDIRRTLDLGGGPQQTEFTSTGRAVAVTTELTNLERSDRAITLTVIKGDGSKAVLGAGTLKANSEHSVTVTVPTSRDQLYAVVLAPERDGQPIQLTLTISNLARAVIDEDETTGIGNPRVAVHVQAQAERFTRLSVSGGGHLSSIFGLPVLVANGQFGSYPYAISNAGGPWASVPNLQDSSSENWVIAQGTSDRQTAVLSLVDPRTGALPTSATVRRTVLPQPIRLELDRLERVSVTGAAITAFSLGEDTPQVWADVTCDQTAELYLLGTADKPAPFYRSWRSRTPGSRSALLPLELEPGNHQLLIASPSSDKKLECTVAIRPLSGPTVSKLGQQRLSIPAGQDFAAYVLSLPSSAVLTAARSEAMSIQLLCKETADTTQGNVERFLAFVPKGSRCTLLLSRPLSAPSNGGALELALWIAYGGDS
jgi:hypothetical protein